MNLELIHQDKRGTISTVKSELLGHPEVTIFTTKKGLARGGCIHNKSDEYACVISGKIEYVIDGRHYLMFDGDAVTIKRGEPHYFISLTDSVVLEWGATEEEKKYKHEVYRKIVDGINENQSN